MLGAPGSGKGTQAQKLHAEFGIPQVSTGDLLRGAVAANSPLGIQAKAVMDAGELVSDSIVLGMIEERLVLEDARKGFILDGYPRNRGQAEDLEQVLARLGISLDAAVLMDVDFDILLKRLTGRRTCSTTGALLNIYFSPRAEIEKCLASGGTLVQRDDDNEETIRNRLDVYRAQTAPLIDYYGAAGLLKTVMAEGTVSAVYAALKIALGLDGPTKGAP